MNTKIPVLDFPFADRIPAELESDTNAIILKLSTGKPLDRETYSRIRERADAIRDEVYRKHGLLEIGVPTIRETRDGE